MTANDDRIDARDWSLLAVLSVLWGGSFFFNGVVLKELPPLTVVLLRVALAAMILLPVLRVLPDPLSGGAVGLEAVFRDRASQQRPAILADRDGTDLHPEWTGLDPERNDAVVHRSGDGCRRRRKTARATRRGSRHRVDRRDHSSWTRRSWPRPAWTRPAWTRSGLSER